MSIATVLKYLEPEWAAVRTQMRSALGTDVTLLHDVNEGILSNQGKMLRPILSLLVAKACGEVNADSIRIAAASQMLHDSTLLHDDVVDDGKSRRGRPTVSSLLGGTASVLIGDYWLVKAVETILSVSHSCDRLIRIFSKTLSDLAEGEMLQMEKAGSGDTSMDDYLRIIYSKTASLFEASTTAAAITVNASDELFAAAREYGGSLGIAFQIKDDIMDYVSGGEIGKPVGVDIKEKKITLPLLGAMKLSGKEKEMREALLKVDEHPEHCKMIHDFVISNGGVEYAREILQDYSDRAKKALRQFGEGEAATLLGELADYVGYRTV